MHLELAITVIVVALVIAFAALNPHLMKTAAWRATVTPLASIIGSGFLVAGPIPAHTVGNWAWLAMTGLCVTAYLFGSAIRYNIAHVEPMLDNGAPIAVRIIERASHFALAFAYFVSVAYYLNLFAAFLLRGIGITSQEVIRILASTVILGVGGYGASRGLKGLEFVEELAVGIKLSAIGGLVAAMAVYVVSAMAGDGITLHPFAHTTGLQELQVLLGLLILVQGFETSRFLGSGYDRQTRCRTMQYAQWFSMVIYIVFILLMTPFFSGSLPKEGGETAIIDLLAPLGFIAAPAIIVAAVCSQFSAAVADANGASGLLTDATTHRFSLRTGYILTAAVAVAITWSANIYEIIAYASKAFVLYYGLQSALAVIVESGSSGSRRIARLSVFALGVALSAAIVVFGIPAEV